MVQITRMLENIMIALFAGVQGKGLSVGTPHDEMVKSFGLTWLLAGTSLG